MPWNGFQLGHISELWKKRHEQYGDIFKEKLFSTCMTVIYQTAKEQFLIRNFLCADMVYCRSPEDTERMFRSESRTPTRIKLSGMSKVKKWMELPESMINLEGSDWLKVSESNSELLNTIKGNSY